MDAQKSVIVSLGNEWDYQLPLISEQHKTLPFKIRQGNVDLQFNLERSDYQVRLSYYDGGKWLFGSWGDFNHPSIIVALQYTNFPMELSS